jgi:hypothetical protein
MNLKLTACSLILGFALVTSAAANCIGSSSFQTCYNSSGRTGSTWSQQSSTFGNTTYHTGQTNGQSWNATDQRSGNMRSIYGTDSRGNAFSYTCDAFGNCY